MYFILMGFFNYTRGGKIMKKVYVSTIILAIVVIFGFSKGWFSATADDAQSTWKRLDQQEVIEMIDNPNVLIVDVREDYLYEKSHIPNAVNIPFTEIEQRYQEIDKNKEIVFVCHSGPMGEASSQLLTNKGYKNVANLIGGMAGWTGPTRP